MCDGEREREKKRVLREKGYNLCEIEIYIVCVCDCVCACVCVCVCVCMRNIGKRECERVGLKMYMREREK